MGLIASVGALRARAASPSGPVASLVASVRGGNPVRPGWWRCAAMSEEEARRILADVCKISTRFAQIAKEYFAAGAPLAAGNLQAATTILFNFVLLAQLSGD